MKRKKSTEKRRHPRVPIGLRLDIHSRASRASKEIGRIVDLSVGGMSFETTAELEDATSLYLKVNIPLEIRGEVRHIRKLGKIHRYGVHFHKIGPSEPGAARPQRFVDAKFERP